jgi:DNA-binding NarL/FixJ family response regulator
VRVLIVEDHELLAQSLHLALTAEGMASEVATLSSAEGLVEQVQTTRPDVVLLDLELGDPVGDGIPLVEPFVEAGARVVVVSGTTRRLRFAESVERGAYGFLPKSAPLDELVTAIHAAADGRPLLTEAQRLDVLTELRRERSERREAYAPFAQLSRREAAVLGQLMTGRSATDIAAAAVVSEATVRSQIRAILTKLGVGSQLAAVAVAQQAGWTPPESDTTSDKASDKT